MYKLPASPVLVLMHGAPTFGVCPFDKLWPFREDARKHQERFNLKGCILPKPNAHQFMGPNVRKPDFGDDVLRAIWSLSVAATEVVPGLGYQSIEGPLPLEHPDFKQAHL